MLRKDSRTRQKRGDKEEIILLGVYAYRAVLLIKGEKFDASRRSALKVINHKRWNFSLPSYCKDGAEGGLTVQGLPMPPSGPFFAHRL